MTDMSQSTRIYLFRHGAVAPESLNRFNGVTDCALDLIKGPARYNMAADYLVDAPPEILYSSPLSRCRLSAAVLAERFGLEVEIEQDIGEQNFGMFEGLSFIEARDQHGQAMAKWFADLAHYRLEGGETMAEVQARAWPVMKEIARRHPGKRVAVVAHGAVNRLILAKVLDLSIQNVLNIAQEYGCLNILDIFPDNTVVKGLNILCGSTLPPEAEDAS